MLQLELTINTHRRRVIPKTAIPGMLPSRGSLQLEADPDALAEAVMDAVAAAKLILAVRVVALLGEAVNSDWIGA